MGKNSTSRKYNVSLSAGTNRISFSVPITNDNLLEYNEEFDLIINQSSLPFNVNFGNVYQTTVTIVDDDGELLVLSRTYSIINLCFYRNYCEI